MSEQYEGEMSFADAVAAAMGNSAPPAPAAAPSEVVSAPETAPNPAPSEPSQPSAPETAAQVAPAEQPNPLSAELAALKAEIEALKAVKAQPEPQRAPEPVVDEPFELDFDTHATVDPVGAIAKIAKKFNIDPKDLAADLWYESLGSKAPPEYLAKREGKAGQLAAKVLEAKSAKERQEAEERSRQYGHQEAEQRYVGALVQHVSDPAAASKYSKSNKLAKAIPQMVAAGMWNHAATLQQKHGRPPAPEEVAAELEKELQALAEVLRDDVPAAQPAAPVAPKAVSPAPVAADAPSSLRNQHTQVQPSRGTEDEFDDEALRRKAMEAYRAHVAALQA